MPRDNDANEHSNLRALLIDDDVELGDLMREFFTERGHALTLARDGRRGLELGLDGVHDVVLLDVMLPGLDGFTVLRQLRRRSAVPIIMLTARTARDDRINGLEAGADDYLPKPFDPAELLARIRAVMRRVHPERTSPPETVSIGPVKLVLGTREVFCDGRRVPATSTEFDILEYLMHAAGRTVSRNELMTVLHQVEATPFDRSLDVHVSHLRKKLADAGTWIRTVRGVGYLYCSETGNS